MNSGNKNLQLLEEIITQAMQKSHSNPPASVQPNDVQKMVEDLLLKSKPDKKEELRAKIYEKMNSFKEELFDTFEGLKPSKIIFPRPFTTEKSR